MIKFFRHIRQRLLSDGKTRPTGSTWSAGRLSPSERRSRAFKYLIYAIGEIILVVIGILIALQFNNWNEHRKDFQKSKIYLEEILKDLKGDTILFNRAITSLSTTIDIEEWAINRVHDNTSPTDSLWMSFGGVYYEFAINDRTFQKVQNAGDSQFTGFESVTDEINNYYAVTKKRVEDHTAWDKKEVTENQSYMRDLEAYIEIDRYRMDYIGAGIIEKSFSIRQDTLEHLRMMVEFANSTKGRNHFKNNYIRHSRVLNQFNKVQETATGLINKINREIEQTNG
jgi:hypothetical protein